jgi:hypothetical protein
LTITITRIDLSFSIAALNLAGLSEDFERLLSLYFDVEREEAKSTGGGSFSPGANRGWQTMKDH